MKTSLMDKKEVKRRHYLVDAEGNVLGRLACKVASILSGKRKRDYIPYLDNGDFVIVVNASRIVVTGDKLQQKLYTHFSGYPSGLKIKNLETLLRLRPSEVIRHAVKGMLPKNRLGSRMITRLKIYAGPEHPHKAQNPERVDIKG